MIIYTNLIEYENSFTGKIEQTFIQIDIIQVIVATLESNFLSERNHYRLIQQVQPMM